jgi:hypothetical protein
LQLTDFGPRGVTVARLKAGLLTTELDIQPIEEVDFGRF